MPFLLKIIFAALVFVIVGAATILMITDVSVPQKEITKTVANDRFL